MKPKHCEKAMVGVYLRKDWMLVGYHCNICGQVAVLVPE